MDTIIVISQFINVSLLFAFQRKMELPSVEERKLGAVAFYGGAARKLRLKRLFYRGSGLLKTGSATIM